MAAKKSMKESRGREWSENEFKEFASVLTDDRTEFALTLEIHSSVLPTSAFLSHCLSWRRREIDSKSCNAPPC